MSSISGEKKLFRYYKIYEQIYENPFISASEIAQKTKIARSTVSKDLTEMYNNFMVGPAICLKPAQNYHLYTALLKVKNPLLAYWCFRRFPKVVYRSLASGSWNLLLISEKCIDFSFLKGFKEYIYYGVKGVTFLSKVETVDWNKSLERMYDMLDTPAKKSFLYKEVPLLPWGKEEWRLYHTFRHNVRVQVTPLLKVLGIRYEQYRKWLSSLSGVAEIQVSFYPHGVNNYFAFDFLFKSTSHKQLVDILGQLPSTCFFSSVGEYLLARLSVMNRKEKDDLLTFIFELGKKGFFTDFCHALLVSPSRNNFTQRGTE